MSSLAAASLNEVKKALETMTDRQLREYCLRMAKYKKENKELLSYILFLESDVDGFVRDIKHETDDLFAAINTDTLYLSTKSLRKILRVLNKYIKFSGNKIVEVEVLLYFCQKLKKSKIRIMSSVTLTNLYNRQVEKVYRALRNLHEDLLSDYQHEFDSL